MGRPVKNLDLGRIRSYDNRRENGTLVNLLPDLPMPEATVRANEMAVRAEGRDRHIVTALIQNETGLGLAIRENPTGGWSSMPFKLNTPEQLAFSGDLVPILP